MAAWVGADSRFSPTGLPNVNLPGKKVGSDSKADRENDNQEHEQKTDAAHHNQPSAEPHLQFRHRKIRKEPNKKPVPRGDRLGFREKADA
jgi:hypothetical protein